MTEITPNALGLAQAGVHPAGLDGTVDELWYHPQGWQVYQKLRMRLDLFDESIVMTQYDDGEAVRCYEVSPDDVAAALSGTKLTTGILPDGCLFYARDGGAPRIGIYLPAQERTLTVVVPEREEITIPVPDLVFVGHCKRYEIFAVDGRPSSEDRLYHAPFPNVYDSGSICWGGVDVPACNPATIREAAELFLSSEFNADLNNGKSESHKGDVTRMWRQLQEDGADVYPVDDLIVSRTTMEDLWT